ncbi:MAG: polysaccharide deacetylase family protein [Terriglobales bacterium]
MAALLYHNVGAQLPGTYPSLTVPAARFSRQMEALARRGYTGISARDWLRAAQDGALPPRSVILTFDDGYQELAQHAFPVLQKHGFTATVFVVTALMGGEDEWLRREGKSPQGLLDEGQIRHWAERGIEFGAHSATHADLTKLPPAALAEEVGGSRRALESVLQARVQCFAYPYGFYNRDVVESVGREFEVAFTVEEGMNTTTTPRYQLRRTMVQPRDSALGVWLRAANGRHPLQALRARLSRTKKRLLGEQDA